MSKSKVSAVQVGGFRPTLDPFATNFGIKALALEGESWPESAGKPLLFVCQLNLTQAPVVPPSLADIQLITFFVEPDTAALGEENGSNWVLRAYKSLTSLAPLTQPAAAPRVKKGFECRWEEIAGAKAARTRIGGSPSEIQSEPWWDYRAHPANPKFCLQVNSEEKVGLMWGDSGTVFLARGTTAGFEDKWFLDIQFF
ncbi:MAG TPA: DUF1963 domain-containing protein [Bryobacteraceae bacterium]|jgi:hypothetical protein